MHQPGIGTRDLLIVSPTLNHYTTVLLRKKTRLVKTVEFHKFCFFICCRFFALYKGLLPKVMRLGPGKKCTLFLT